MEELLASLRELCSAHRESMSKLEGIRTMREQEEKAIEAKFISSFKSIHKALALSDQCPPNERTCPRILGTGSPERGPGKGITSKAAATTVQFHGQYFLRRPLHLGWWVADMYHNETASEFGGDTLHSVMHHCYGTVADEAWPLMTEGILAQALFMNKLDYLRPEKNNAIKGLLYELSNSRAPKLVNILKEGDIVPLMTQLQNSIHKPPQMDSSPFPLNPMQSKECEVIVARLLRAIRMGNNHDRVKRTGSERQRGPDLARQRTRLTETLGPIMMHLMDVEMWYVRYKTRTKAKMRRIIGEMLYYFLAPFVTNRNAVAALVGVEGIISGSLRTAQDYGGYVGSANTIIEVAQLGDDPFGNLQKSLRFCLDDVIERYNIGYCSQGDGGDEVREKRSGPDPVTEFALMCEGFIETYCESSLLNDEMKDNTTAPLGTSKKFGLYKTIISRDFSTVVESINLPALDKTNKLCVINHPFPCVVDTNTLKLLLSIPAVKPSFAQSAALESLVRELGESQSDQQPVLYELISPPQELSGNLSITPKYIGRLASFPNNLKPKACVSVLEALNNIDPAKSAIDPSNPFTVSLVAFLSHGGAGSDEMLENLSLFVEALKTVQKNFSTFVNEIYEAALKLVEICSLPNKCVNAAYEIEQMLLHTQMVKAFFLYRRLDMVIVINPTADNRNGIGNSLFQVTTVPVRRRIQLLGEMNNTPRSSRSLSELHSNCVTNTPLAQQKFILAMMELPFDPLPRDFMRGIDGFVLFGDVMYYILSKARSVLSDCGEKVGHLASGDSSRHYETLIQANSALGTMCETLVRKNAMANGFRTISETETDTIASSLHSIICHDLSLKLGLISSRMGSPDLRDTIGITEGLFDTPFVIEHKSKLLGMFSRPVVSLCDIAGMLVDTSNSVCSLAGDFSGDTRAFGVCEMLKGVDNTLLKEKYLVIHLLYRLKGETGGVLYVGLGKTRSEALFNVLTYCGMYLGRKGG